MGRHGAHRGWSRWTRCGTNRSGFFEEFLRAQRSRRHASPENRAFEKVHLVDAHSERRLAGFLRLEMNFSRAFENAINVIAEPMTVIDGCRVMPGIERVQPGPVQKNLLHIPGFHEGVETPLVPDYPDLEKHPVVRTVFLKMEEALFGCAAGCGPEDHFPRPGFRRREWMDVEEDGIVNAVEFERFAAWSRDDYGMAEDRCRMAANAFEIID